MSGGVDLLVDLGFDLNGSGSDLLRRLTGVDERRCLLSSRLISASSVLPCLLLRLLCKELPHLTFGPRCKGESEAFAGDFFSVLISKQPPWRLGMFGPVCVLRWPWASCRCSVLSLVHVTGLLSFLPVDGSSSFFILQSFRRKETACFLPTRCLETGTF